MTHSAKRRYPRYSLDRPLVAHRVYDDVTLSFRGRWRSFGEGGAGAQMTEQFRVGEVIRLQLSASLCVYAAVRYGRGFEHGFEFVLLRDRQRTEIKRLCCELNRDSQEPSFPIKPKGWRLR